MYEIQVMQPYFSGEPLGQTSIGSDWDETYSVPQLETEQAELQEARRVANEVRRYYTQVRIVKWGPGGGVGEVVV